MFVQVTALRCRACKTVGSLRWFEPNTCHQQNPRSQRCGRGARERFEQTVGLAHVSSAHHLPSGAELPLTWAYADEGLSAFGTVLVVGAGHVKVFTPDTPPNCRAQSTRHPTPHTH